MRKIPAVINGYHLNLDVTMQRNFKSKDWFGASHVRVVNKGHAPSSWPFKRMLPNECILIPWSVASKEQIHNAINGYTRHADGAKFRYRSERSGMAVWCKSQRERKPKPVMKGTTN